MQCCYCDHRNFDSVRIAQLNLNVPEKASVRALLYICRRKDVFMLYTTRKGNYGFYSEHASAIRDILLYIWDGLKRRSRYCVALHDYPPGNFGF
jgi:hypothetical protein